MVDSAVVSSGGISMTLEREQEFFSQVKDDLLKHHERKYALIYNAELISVWDSPESAYRDGIGRFGNVSFLIKHIVEEEPVETIPILFLGGI